MDEVRLWDGTGSTVQPRTSVEVRDGRVSWIGPASEYKGNRSSIRVVDGRARVLIPGLMDCHVHYSGPGGPDWIARFQDPLPELSTRAVELAETSLRSGVTTARDVGAPHGVNIRLSKMARTGEILAPNIRAAGSWIAHRGTYVPFVRLFDSTKDLRDAIKEQIEAGADLIKVALAPWNADAKPEIGADVPFDERFLAVAVEEAHKNKFRISCHANDPISCRIAARAGVDSLEHGMFLQPNDLQAMSRNHTFLVPTMSVWDSMQYYAHTVDWPETRKKRADDLRENSRKAVAGAIGAGVQIALGTDAGGGAARHGRIAREAELMVEAGMPPASALMAGTSNAAMLIDEPERGTIEVGKIADMVLLDGNPLENIAALRLVAAVFQSGRLVVAATL